jgi:hypothetical protein
MKYWLDGFYQEQIGGSVAITDEYWQELLEGQSTGKQIVTDKDGYPVTVDPQITEEELSQGIRLERGNLITSIRWRIERHQDELALGLEPTEPIEPILEYIQALRDVPSQESFPHDIVWPEVPEERMNED